MEFMKEMSDLFFNDLKNKTEIIAVIKDFQFSQNSVMRHTEKMDEMYENSYIIMILINVLVSFFDLISR